MNDASNRIWARGTFPASSDSHGNTRKVSGVRRVLHVFDHSLPVQSGYSFRSLAILREQRRMGIETLQVTGSKHPAVATDEDQQGFWFHRTAPGRFASLPILNQYDVVLGLESRLAALLERDRVS